MSYRSGGGGARRGHLSHKVPNVKLRPAFAPTASEVETSNVDEGASTREKRKRRKLQEEEDDNALSAMDKERIRALNERDGVIGRCWQQRQMLEPDKYLVHHDSSSTIPLRPATLCLALVSRLA